MAENDTRESEYFLLGLILAALTYLIFHRFAFGKNGGPALLPSRSSSSDSSSSGCGCGGCSGGNVIALGTNSLDSQMSGYPKGVPSAVVFAQQS
jgi:hypothetical protein